jgi:hypothetical protein
MVDAKEEMVPLSEAENEVKIVVQRLALLHLSYAKTLVEEFGWEKGKQLVLNAIREYGIRVSERTKKGYKSLPKYGFYENRKGKPPLCEFAKVILEYGELDIGSLYCLIDVAKTMAADPEHKIIHTKSMTVGDECCEFADLPTTKAERKDFDKNNDWAYLDPKLGNFYRKDMAKKKKR